jgi:hypothetical protein
MQADDAKRNQINANTKSFDLFGNRLSIPIFQPFMTLNDLNSLLFNTRTYVQQAIVLDRGNVDLADMVNTFTVYVNQIKIKRYKLKTISVNEMPLHVLCNRVGLPYNAADDVMQLNDIPTPDFCVGDVQIYAAAT